LPFNWIHPFPDTLGGRELGFVARRERLGVDVKGAGDVNGDGYEDYLIGSPYVGEENQFTQGRIYVVYGGPGLDPQMDLSLLLTPDNDKGFVIYGADAQTFEDTYKNRINSSMAGWAVMGDVDINADGLKDIVIAAPNENIMALPSGDGFRPETQGNLYVVFGGTNLPSIRLADLKETGNGQGFMVRTEGVFSIFEFASYGIRISRAGDVNNDGFDDIEVMRKGLITPVASYILHGKEDDAPVVLEPHPHIPQNEAESGLTYIRHDLVIDEVTEGPLPTGHQNNTWTNAGGHDVNGDGTDDFVVKSYYKESWGPPPTPLCVRYFVFFGGEDPPHQYSIATFIAEETDGFMIESCDDIVLNRAADVKLSDDMNGDGLGDIIIAHGRAETPSGRKGAVYVVFGKPDYAKVDLADVAAGLGGYVIYGDNDRNSFGDALSTEGDINGDGLNDLLIGSSRYDEEFTSGGRAYIVYGHDFSRLDYKGDEEDNTYSASSPGERMIGGRGDDRLTSAGGRAVVYGGAGNDVLTVTDANFLKIKGGSGYDTLVLDLVGEVDLLANRSRVSGIEKVELASGATLILDPGTVAGMSSTSTDLLVHSHGGDPVAGGANLELKGAGWVDAGEIVLNGLAHRRFARGHLTVTVAGLIQVASPPFITSKSFAFNEGAAAGAPLGQVEAHDGQGDSFTFSITGGDSSGFTIDPNGMLRASGQVEFDYEEGQRIYHLIIRVEDTTGRSTETTVHLTVLDINEPPQFVIPPQVEVHEGIASGTKITKVTATDEDAGDTITFGIVSGNEEGIVTLDPQSGKLVVVKDFAFDYEQQEFYTFVISATDSENLSSTTEVVVKVLDESVLNRSYAFTFFSSNRDLWSAGEVVELPNLPIGFGYDVPEGDPTSLDLGLLGRLDTDISGTFTLNGAIEATGGGVNPTIPVEMSIAFPDEMTPGETIDITTALVYRTPSMWGQSAGFVAKDVQVVIENANLKADYILGDDTNSVVDETIEELNTSKETLSAGGQFMGDSSWNDSKKEVTLAFNDTILNIQKNMNGAIAAALDKLGLPNVSGELHIVDDEFLDIIWTYTYIDIAYGIRVDLDHDLRLKMNGVQATLTIEDGLYKGGQNTVIAFMVGETIQYTVPAGATGKIPATVEFEMDATFTNITTPVATISPNYQFLDNTVTIKRSFADDVVVGTDGPVIVFNASFTASFEGFNESFPMGGFQKTSFSTRLDLAQ
jgi:hypothetical protein